MNETPTRERKVPMSVRLPRTVVERLDDYARLNGMSRTDAIVHYLERGMDGTLQPESAELLRSIDSRLDEACIALGKIVGERQAADRAGGSIGQGITADLVHAISAVCERFPAVRRAYVFGSFARGTAGPESDIDLRVELSPGAAFNLHDLDHLCKQIEQAVGRDVDAVSARKIKNDSLARAIEREKVLVYERETR